MNYLSKTATIGYFSLGFTLLGLSFFAVVLTAAGADARETIDLKKALSDLRNEWKAGNVTEVMILHTPKTTYFPIGETQTRLDAGAAFRMVVSAPQEHETTQLLMKAVEKVTAQSTGEEPDLRWGFVFFRSNRDRVFSIYLDGSGRLGSINGSFVVFQSDELIRWAEARLGPVLK